MTFEKESIVDRHIVKRHVNATKELFDAVGHRVSRRKVGGKVTQETYELWPGVMSTMYYDLFFPGRRVLHVHVEGQGDWTFRDTPTKKQSAVSWTMPDQTIVEGPPAAHEFVHVRRNLQREARQLGRNR